MSNDDRFAEAAEASPLNAAAVDPATGHRSLENVHGSIEVPHHQAGFWQQWKAFVGPAILVSVAGVVWRFTRSGQER